MDIDFEPTTEEGQADINVDDEDTALEQAENDPIEFMSQLRDNPNLMSRLIDRFKQKNPGKDVPEYLELQNFEDGEPVDVRLQREVVDSLRERFPKVDLARIEVKAGEKGQIQIRYAGKDTWYDLYQRKDPTKLNGKLSKEIKDALGEENQILQLEGIENKLTDLKELDELKEELKEKDKEYMKQNKLLIEAQQREKGDMNERILKLTEEKTKALQERNEAIKAFDLAKNEAGIKDEEIKNLKTTISNTEEEKKQLEARIDNTIDQILQRDQAIEDLENQVEEQQQIINDESRSEEEREAAQKELENLQEQITELQEQKENLERELGLTTKEKIKRALLKYGLPLAFAVAISSVVGVIFTMLKATGAGVKKVGQGLANLGKKMAASIPGLLGSVLSLVLRTGGELLKFVGNNIWILVVAIGAVLLKKIR